MVFPALKKDYFRESHFLEKVCYTTHSQCIEGVMSKVRRNWEWSFLHNNGNKFYYELIPSREIMVGLCRDEVVMRMLLKSFYIPVPSTKNFGDDAPSRSSTFEGDLPTKFGMSATNLRVAPDLSEKVFDEKVVWLWSSDGSIDSMRYEKEHIEDILSASRALPDDIPSIPRFSVNEMDDVEIECAFGSTPPHFAYLEFDGGWSDDEENFPPEGKFCHSLLHQLIRPLRYLRVGVGVRFYMMVDEKLISGDSLERAPVLGIEDYAPEEDGAIIDCGRGMVLRVKHTVDKDEVWGDEETSGMWCYSSIEGE